MIALVQEVLVLELGFLNYQEAHLIQLGLQRRRQEGKLPDLLILTEHPPTITVGRSGGREHILVPDEHLAKSGIPVYQVERGGSVTYHGPGQLVAYPIVDLSGREKDVQLYVHQLEEVGIRVLHSFGITTAGRRLGHPGVWVGSEKIAALGVAVSGWVTMHGLALNVNPDLSYFQLIVPCGLRHAGVTSIARLCDALGRPAPSLKEVTSVFKLEFGSVFGYQTMLPTDLTEMQVKGIGATEEGSGLLQEEAPVAYRDGTVARSSRPHVPIVEVGGT